MKEKTKKYLIMSAYRGAFALGIFIILQAIGAFAPSLIENLSPVWTKSINISKVKSLSYNLLKELFPF